MKKPRGFFIYFGLLFGSLLFVGLTALTGPATSQAAELILPLNYVSCPGPQQDIVWSWHSDDNAVRVQAHQWDAMGLKTTFCDSGSINPNATSYACRNWPNTAGYWVEIELDFQTGGNPGWMDAAPRWCPAP